MYSPGPSRPQQATETRPIRNIQDRKKDLGILPYILMYGKLLKGFSAVPISADKMPADVLTKALPKQRFDIFVK
jgi:hypothetical protein